MGFQLLAIKNTHIIDILSEYLLIVRTYVKHCQISIKDIYAQKSVRLSIIKIKKTLEIKADIY